MFTRLCAAPGFLLTGLLLSLAGVFTLSLLTGKTLLGLALLLTGSAVVYLSQRGAVRKSFEVSKPGQRQK